MAVFMTKKEWSVKEYLTIVMGAAEAAVLLDNLTVSLFMYGLRLKSKDSDKETYVNTMVSTEKVLSGKCGKDNLSLVKNRIHQGMSALFNKDLELSAVLGGGSEKKVIPPKVAVETDHFSDEKKVESTGKVKLRDASSVGQPVSGTSGGSVYYAIAISKSIKVAARLKSDDTLSIRVEGSPSADVQLRLSQLGMDKSQEHWSTHFKLNNLPVERVIGAFLLGIGEKWSARVDSIAELKSAIHAK